MFEALLPKGAPFFELLLDQNKILCEAADTLVDFFEKHPNNQAELSKITELEAKADVIHVAVTKHLSQTFITPIDREDILHVNKAQEEAVDLLRNAAKRIGLLELDEVRLPMLEVVRVLRSMVLLTRSMLEGLSKKIDSHNTSAFLALRDECEMLLSKGLGELYDVAEFTPKTLVGIIKWIRAYDRMELVINQVVILVECIEEAVLKNV